MKADKSMIRSLVRRGTDSRKVHPSEARLGRRAEPVLCEVCGDRLAGRRWQHPGVAEADGHVLERAAWETCPACAQQREEQYLGRVRASGPGLAGVVSAVRRRVHNVARRAEFTTPAHRIISIEDRNGEIEILTTSQKLAHRVAHELRKAFGGRATYAWLDDGCLEARWRAPAARTAKA